MLGIHIQSLACKAAGQNYVCISTAQLSLLSCYSFLPSSKYSLEQSVLKHPQPILLKQISSVTTHTQYIMVLIYILLLTLYVSFAGTCHPRLLFWKYVLFFRVQAHFCSVNSALSTRSYNKSKDVELETYRPHPSSFDSSRLPHQLSWNAASSRCFTCYRPDHESEWYIARFNSTEKIVPLQP